MKMIIIYDNWIPKNETITDIIGSKSFADILINQKQVESVTKKQIDTLFSRPFWKRINTLEDYQTLIQELRSHLEEPVKILHLFSSIYMIQPEKALLSYQKLLYIDKPFRILFHQTLAGLMFPNIQTYLSFCQNRAQGQSPLESASTIADYFPIEGVADLSHTTEFIQCIAGNFDSRYFNSLQEDTYTVTKTSFNKEKIKKEYTYYQLLPEDMQPWFVQPYHYVENKNSACYTMERLHVTDLAFKWVHGSIGIEEFTRILDAYFHFFKIRHSRPCSEKKYRQLANDLYVTKVQQRIKQLKKHSRYPQLQMLLQADGLELDTLANRYLAIKEKIEKKNTYPQIEVIGHGDPCFANTLYNKVTQLLKFIDPKGALSEEEMWTNPYYDIAKLSHSVCGKYDFFNNGLCDIKLNKQLHYELIIPVQHDQYQQLFREKLQCCGYDFLTVRIYEASLFLSMLPLHMDNPYKVLGFILNAKVILDEVEKNV